MAVKQETIEDVLHKIDRLIGTANALMERNARAFEEIDGIRLAHEELRELFKEHFAENALWADKLSRQMIRLEQYTILSKFGNVSATLDIEATTSKEHIKRSLREELIVQRELYAQYQKNKDRVLIRVAKFGETVRDTNELEGYNDELTKLGIVIERIRKALE